MIHTTQRLREEREREGSRRGGGEGVSQDLTFSLIWKRVCMPRQGGGGRFGRQSKLGDEAM